MRRVAIKVSWRASPGEVESGELYPTDLNTRDGIEYMKATMHNGETIEIRLDQILESVVL